jgi:hypothetical protein
MYCRRIALVRVLRIVEWIRTSRDSEMVAFSGQAAERRNRRRLRTNSQSNAIQATTKTGSKTARTILSDNQSVHF